MPTRATKGSVGYDVKCLELYGVHTDGTKYRIYDEDYIDYMIEKKIGFHHLEVNTGVHVQPEDGYYVELVPNSRLGKLNVIYGNSIGVIDPDYTGAIRVLLNTTKPFWDDDVIKKFLPGNVVGQLIVRQKFDAEWELTDKLDETVRGDGGFGSTEKHV